MAAFTVPAIFKAVDKMTAPVRKMQKSIRGFGRSAANSMKRASISVTTFNRRITTMHSNVRKKVKGILGSLGSLGAGIGIMLIASQVAMANIELDKSLASLSAITGATGVQFDTFRKKIDEVSKAQKLFAGDTAKAFEIVGSAQPILLKNADALAMVTTASITLSKAGLMPVEDAAGSLTGTMNQFNLGADQAQRVINVLAAGAKEGSANIKLLSESFDKVGGVAKSANMTLEQTGAAIELMSKFNLKGSEAGISLKSTILRLKSAQLGFKSGQFNLNDALHEYNKIANAVKDPIKKAAYEEKVFGKVHILTGKILTENISELNRLTDVMSNTDEATKQAAINSNTFAVRLKEIQNAFKNSITATDKQGVEMQSLKNIMVIVADNMDKIIATVIKIVAVFAIYKAATLALKGIQLGLNVVIGAYNILLGISQARSASLAVGVGGSTAAMHAQKIATYALIAAQWLYNGALKAMKMAQLLYTGSLVPAIAATWAFTTALLANPITWIVIGIMALIAGIVLLIVNWKDVVAWMKKVWEQFKNTKFIQKIITDFKNFVAVIKNVVAKLKEIGNIIKTFIIDKFKAVSEFISKIVDRVAKFFGRNDTLKAEESLIIQAERQGGLQDVLGRNASADLAGNVINNREVITRDNNSPITTQNNSKVDLFINNRASGTEAFAEGTGVEVHNTGY